jgi:hypothetical protein
MRALVAGAQVAAQVAARPVPRWPRAWCPGGRSLVRDPRALVRDPRAWRLVAGGRRPGALAHGPRALQRK